MSLNGLSSADILSRIEEALAAAARTVAAFAPGKVKAEHKPDFSPVTEADRAVDRVLKKILLRSGEGWLSEESVDSPERLGCENVWVVDPLDGTLEFVQGIPEWCISVGYSHAGKAFAGGIVNPVTGELILGSLESGVIYNGSPAQPSSRGSLAGAVVLASRSEIKRGEWERFRGGDFEVRPMGSVAYKLALVAAGRADATWTLSPKNEWDVAAGVALIQAGGGYVTTLEGAAPTFNNRSSLMSGLVAGAPGLQKGIEEVLDLSVTAGARG